jgi:hypothetical protein
MHRLKARLRLKQRLTYSNLASTTALVLALIGGSTAIAISKQVGTKQLKNQAVTANKIRDGNITASKLAAVDVVQVTGGNSSAAHASCPGSERLIGGGARIDISGPSAALRESRPDGNGWTAQPTNGSSAVVYALCLRGS